MKGLSELTENYYFSVPNFELRKIIVATTSGYCFIPLDKIAFIESIDGITRFHLTNFRSIDTSKELDYFHSFLKEFGFYKVHRKFVIQVSEALHFNHRRQEFVMRSGDVVPTEADALETLVNMLERGELQL